MKNILKITIIAILILAFASSIAFATTEAELEKYLLDNHTVAGTSVHLTEANKVKVQRYLAENDITDEQAAAIKAKVEEIKAYLNKIGVYEVSQLDKDQKKEALRIANEALAEIGLSATYNSDDRTVEIYKDGKKIEAVYTDPGKLVQTGSNNIVWISVVSVAVVALASVVIFKKVKNNE